MKPPKAPKRAKPSAAVPQRGTRADKGLDIIRRLRGILKRPPGAPSLAREMAAHKRAEKALEDK